MSLGWRAGALLLTIALLASRCGGHGAENFTGTPNPSGSPGGPTGAAAVIEFVAPGGTTSGTSATRRSPGAISRGTPISMPSGFVASSMRHKISSP